MSRFVLPDLGEGLKEAEIVEWHVAEGDHVVADQPLLAVETEKAVVEVPSPRAGRISHLLAKLGDRVHVGAPLVEFEEGPHPDTGTVVGDLRPAPAPAPSLPSPARAPQVGIPAVKATPAVRALATVRNVDLSQIRGTGPYGTVTRDDVMRSVAPAASAARGEPLRGVRLSMARNMMQARQAAVPATIFDDADIESWYDPKADVTLRLIRAIVAGCAAEPSLNCWFDEAHMIREVKAKIDLGIAMDTEAGLIVPVLSDAGSGDATTSRQSLDALKAAVRTRSVSPAQLRGATITLSNFGVIGGRYAALTLLPPQVAIIGAGRIDRCAVSEAQATAFHAQLPLSLTFDHRVVTGGEAARFMNAMIGDLQRAS